MISSFVTISPFTDAEIIAFLLLFLTVAVALLTNSESKVIFIISTNVLAVILGVLLGMDETSGNRYLEYYLYFWLALIAIEVGFVIFQLNSFRKW
jgi:hypothetical protein